MKKKQPESNVEELILILISVWRRMNKLSGPPDKLQTREFRGVVEAIQTLQKENCQDFAAKPNLFGAYMLYHNLIHYQQGLSLINELPFSPKRVWDVCAGFSPFGLAALKHGAREVISTDISERALEVGAEIAGRFGHPITIRKWDSLKQNPPVEGKFDLIIVGHCLETLFPSSKKDWNNAQHNFLMNLMNYLTPDGYLLIVGDSQLEPNKRILQIRDRFVENNIPIQAPCVFKGLCPALQTKDSPCYAQREFEKPHLIREIQRSAKINLGSLKMSYIIFRHPLASWPKPLEEPLYRVISPPVDTFHGKRYYLCGTTGKHHINSRFKSHPPQAKAFDYLKRGELISVKDALIKAAAIDLIEDSKVKVVAACGKPIVETESFDEYK